MGGLVRIPSATVLGIAELAVGVAALESLLPLFRRMRLLRRAVGPQPEREARNRSAGIVTLVAIVAEIVALLVAIRLVALVDPELIQPTVAAVVGAHFLVFWFSRSTASPLHLWMTALGLAIGVAGIAAVLGGARPALVHSMVGLAMAGVTIAYDSDFVVALRSEEAPLMAPRSSTAGAEFARSAGKDADMDTAKGGNNA